MIIILYLVIYNLTLLILFIFIFSLKPALVKTILLFELARLDFFYLVSFSIIFLSLAGIPPFLGFFSKLFILSCLVFSNFWGLFILLFILLFISLYFYLQNIRILYQSTAQEVSLFSLTYNPLTPSLVSWVIIWNTFLTIGWFYLDDLILLIFFWIS